MGRVLGVCGSVPSTTSRPRRPRSTGTSQSSGSSNKTLQTSSGQPCRTRRSFGGRLWQPKQIGPNCATRRRQRQQPRFVQPLRYQTTTWTAATAAGRGRARRLRRRSLYVNGLWKTFSTNAATGRADSGNKQAINPRRFLPPPPPAAFSAVGGRTATSAEPAAASSQAPLIVVHKPTPLCGRVAPPRVRWNEAEDEADMDQ